jgi:biotin-dependent carboxylase-like uncharacterized protein
LIEIVTAGIGATVQDLGRVGYTGWGISPGGAADRGSLQLANRLVGNRDDAAAFEILLGGFAARFTTAATVAVTGAPAPVLVDRRALGSDGPTSVPAGALVRLLAPPSRLRSYLAVRGGLDTEVLLGSRSVDEASGIGRALRAGDQIAVGTDTVAPPTADLAPRAGWPSGPVVLTGTAGPHDDWFTDAALGQFAAGRYMVAPAADRIGIRLSGPALHRRHHAEVVSTATLRGAVEVPGDGQPIVFGPDHPTTCGYPVVAVLDPPSADLISQCRPGQQVTFTLRRPAIRLVAQR